MEKLKQELLRLSLRLMEINQLSSNLYTEKKEIEKNMAVIRDRMLEYTGTTGKTIEEGEI